MANNSRFALALALFGTSHLLAHKAGVVDQQFLEETAGSPSLLGRRLNISASDVYQVAAAVMAIGQRLVNALPPAK